MDHEDFFSKNFTDVTSPLFAETNVNKIYHLAKSDSLSHPISIASIHKLKSEVEAISKLKERHILKGEKRKISHRSWISHGPRNLLIADLFFKEIALFILKQSTQNSLSLYGPFFKIDFFKIPTK